MVAQIHLGASPFTAGKTVVFFGTKHYLADKAPSGIQEALVFVIEKVKPDVVLEEWSTTQMGSLADAVAKSRKIPWVNIGTPAAPEFETCHFSSSLDFPTGVQFRQYGSIEVQEKREAVMCKNLRNAMMSYKTALGVIGLAHLHSMMVKLENDFTVKGYSFADDFF